jgi:ABC-type uncharacterized transport system permease subunit
MSVPQAGRGERTAIGGLVVLALLGLWLTPWAAINREIGARSALLLLPNRVVDFTGRTEPLPDPRLWLVLGLSVLALGTIGVAALLRPKPRHLLWLVAGLSLVGVTVFGLERLTDVVEQARIAGVVQAVEQALESPRDDAQAEQLTAVREGALERPFAETLALARAANVTIRRLPYENMGMAFASFLCLVVGGLAFLFGLRLFPSTGRFIDRSLVAVAIPAVSILLALLAAAVVVLALQPTALGRNVEVNDWTTYLAGRVDTVWYAYQTLFANSFGTLSGFLESLKFATPLILTGLAVAFAFQAGLFNIGAPGQMVLGGLFAMLAGLYMPGPRFIVIPAAVVAAAVGGGLWGAIPGWLKARFGANEVINTILMNYIAASLLLFTLSSNPTFSASSLRIMIVIAVFAVLAILLNLVPAVRHALGRSPRLSFAVAGVLLLGLVVVAGIPRPGDVPTTITMPFKQPGFEPKSYEIRPEARLLQAPAWVGIDVAQSPGTNVARVNYALPLAVAVGLLSLVLLPGLSARFMRLLPRLLAALVAGGLAYLFAALAGLTAVPTAVPPTKLNTSLLIALAAAVVVYFLLWRTKWGYELRAVGLSPKAAEYGGANLAKNTIMAMTLSGALAGLTACHYVLGGALEDYSLRQGLPIDDGFDGIAVALLGANTPIGVVLSAFLFGVLKNGGTLLNITFQSLTRDVVSMILALVVLFIAARGFLPERLTNPLRRKLYVELDPTVTEPIDPTGKRTRSSHEGEGA